MSNIGTALLEAQRNAETLKKDGKNTFAKFDYVSAENVVKTARKVLLDAGLIFHPAEQEVVQGHDGTLWFKQRYNLVHAESGEALNITRSAVFEPEKGKSISQAQGSAETYMLKNILRELLLMPRFGKDEDLDSRDNSYRTAGRPMRARA